MAKKKKEEKKPGKWLEIFYNIKDKLAEDKKWGNALLGESVASVMAYGILLPFSPALAFGSLLCGGLLIIGTIGTMLGWFKAKDKKSQEQTKGSVEKVTEQEIQEVQNQSSNVNVADNKQTSQTKEENNEMEQV